MSKAYTCVCAGQPAFESVEGTDAIFIELVIDASPDAEDTLAHLARRTAAATREEEGCILYRFATDVEHRGRFVLTELWD